MTTEHFDLSGLQNLISAEGAVEHIAADPNRINPSVMQAVMAIASLGQLNKMRRIMEDQVSQGWTFSLNLIVTDAPPGDGFRLDHLGQSISVTNDGTLPVLLGFNSWTNPHTLNAGETLSLNFGVHKLDRIYWQCPTGSSNIRAIVKG